MLEKMADFFETRLTGYDQHMLSNIDGAAEFYTFTAAQLPEKDCASVLDLGCGTGLELEWYFNLNPSANVTGIDLSAGMLGALRTKFPNRALRLIQGSYFDVPFGKAAFDGAVSVESLHHFTQEEKIPLYHRIWEALRPGGWFVLTDYFALSCEEEMMHRRELLRLKREQGIGDDEFYHYDTPLTVEHEVDALKTAGFVSVEILKNWGATYTLKAIRENTHVFLSRP